MKKTLFAISLSFLSFTSYALSSQSDSKLNSNTILTSSKIEKSSKPTLSDKDQEAIRDNVNAAQKLLAIETLCSEHQDALSKIYAHALILSSGFVNPKKIDLAFALNLEKRVIESISDLHKQGEKCFLNRPEQIQEFRKEINGVVVNSFYSLFSNQKTLQDDLKEFSDKSPYYLIESRFMSDKFNITAKNKQDNIDSVLDNYIYAVSGYKNLENCYKSFNMTKDKYNQLKPKIGKLIIEAINSKNFSTVEKITFITTGVVLADTLHKGSCEDTKKTIELFDKLETTKSSR